MTVPQDRLVQIDLSSKAPLLRVPSSPAHSPNFQLPQFPYFQFFMFPSVLSEKSYLPVEPVCQGIKPHRLNTQALSLLYPLNPACSPFLLRSPRLLRVVRHARSLCLRSANLKLVSLFKSLPRKGRETCTLSFSLWGAMEGVAHSPRAPLGLVLSAVFSVGLVHLCPSVVGGSHDPSSCQLNSPPAPFPGRTQLLLRATWLTHSSFPNVSIRALCKVPGVLGSRYLPMSPQRGKPTAGTLPGLLQGHQHLAFSWHQLCSLSGLQLRSPVPVPLTGSVLSCSALRRTSLTRFRG